MNNGTMKDGMGENTNPFYKIAATHDAIISPKANLTPVAVKETLLFDIATQPGKTYTFLMK